MGKLKFYTLKYADDIAIMAEDGGDLKRMLKIMEKFVREIKMEINVNKTKIMIFQNGGRRNKEKWELCEREVEVVNQFKYLGYWFSIANRYGKHLQNVIGKAQKAVNTVWGVMKRAKIDTLKKRLLLMDSLVKAGALYGVEIWGWKRRDGIEKLQGKFVKMALGVARNTPDYIWKL